MNEQEVKKAVGSIIKKYRKNMELTQFALGELISINQRQVALIETGKSFPSLSTMLKLAQVFQCELQDFFRFNNDEHDILYSKTRNIVDNCSTANLKKIYNQAKTIYTLK